MGPRDHHCMRSCSAIFGQQSSSRKDVTTTGALKKIKKRLALLQTFTDDEQLCKITSKRLSFHKSGWLGQRVQTQFVDCQTIVTTDGKQTAVYLQYTPLPQGAATS